jgi:hypothetical protein
VTAEAAPGIDPQDEWIRAFGELLQRTTDSAGIARRREELFDADERGLISLDAADLLSAAIRVRREELFGTLRTRRQQFRTARARSTARGGRLPFPNADRRAS